MDSLSAEQAYLFRHAVVREAAYQLHLPAERAVLHGLALDLMRAQPSTATRAHALELAHHARQAQSARQPAARHDALRELERQYLADGCDYARACFDYPAATEALERRRELCAGDPAALALVEDAMADVLERQGRWPEAMPHFERVLELGTKADYEGRALVHLAWFAMETGEADRADELIRRGEAVAEKADSVQLRISFLMVRARRMRMQDKLDEALQLELMALQLAHESGDWVQELIGSMNLAAALFDLGRDEQALHHAQRADELAQAKPQGRYYLSPITMSFHTAAMRRREFAQALHEAERAASLAERVFARGDRVEALIGCANALVGLGQHTLAEMRLLHAAAICREIGVAPQSRKVMQLLAELRRTHPKP